MTAEFQLWLRHLSQPEYIHVLLNPIPIYGTLLGALALIAGLLFRSRPAQVLALGLIAFSCLAALPTAKYGHAGYDRVFEMSYRDAQAWLDLHEERAEALMIVFYAAAALAGAAIVIPLKARKTQVWLTGMALAGALAAHLAAVAIAHAGGQVRHSEFRDGPPPTPVKHEEHHH